MLRMTLRSMSRLLRSRSERRSWVVRETSSVPEARPPDAPVVRFRVLAGAARPELPAVPGAGIGADSPGVPRFPPLEPERPEAGADGFVALEPGPEEAGADGFGVRLEPGSAEPPADGLVTVLEGLELVPELLVPELLAPEPPALPPPLPPEPPPLDCARAAPESARAATIASAWVRMAVLHVLLSVNPRRAAQVQRPLSAPRSASDLSPSLSVRGAGRKRVKARPSGTRGPIPPP